MELAGLPRLGKSVFADSLVDLLGAAGIRSKLIAKATTECPVADKWSTDFTSWTFAAVLKDYLEARAFGIAVAVADRGLFDSVLWMRMKCESARCSPESVRVFRSLAMCGPWFENLCLVLAFTGDYDLVIRRASDRRLHNGDNTVSKPDVLPLLDKQMREEASLWNRERRIVEVLQVDEAPVRDSMELAAEHVVAAIEAFAKARPRTS